MKNKKITNKEIVRKALLKVGHSLSIDEASSLTGLKKVQVRNTANYYGSGIVPVGKGRVDLLTRAYKSRGLRVTPTEQDIEQGIICSDELYVYLWAFLSKEPIVISEEGEKFTLQRKYRPSKQQIIYDFSKWYQMTNFQAGDDIIFRCRDSEKQEFNIFHLPARKRNEEEILRKNSRLAEMVYNFLKYTPNKFEHFSFLARKSLLRDLYLEEILPDGLFRALSKDRYLFVFLKENYDLFGVGIKKYFHFYKGGFHLVSIFEDEFLGKYGYCTECENPMIWNERQGWRPAGEDEYFDLPLDKSFFKHPR